MCPAPYWGVAVYGTFRAVMPGCAITVPGSGKKSPGRDAKAHENGVKAKDAHDRLTTEIKEYLNKGSSASQLKSFLGSLSGTPQEIMNALIVALCEGVEKGYVKVMAKKKNFLAAAATLEDGSQTTLLHAIECFCGKTRPEALKEAPFILKELYDNDLVEEEFIVDWYQKGLVGGNKDSAIWKNVKPFVEWLQNAESESEEE